MSQQSTIQVWVSVVAVLSCWNRHQSYGAHQIIMRMNLWGILQYRILRASHHDHQRLPFYRLQKKYMSSWTSVYYRPTPKLREGNVFNSVCLFRGGECDAWSQVPSGGGWVCLVPDPFLEVSGYLAYTDHHKGWCHPHGQLAISLICMSLLYNVS